MLTKHERRVLYILRKHGGTAKHSQISQAMARAKAEERQQALNSCETLDLISSAKRDTDGRPGLVYWLTDAGADYVQGLIDTQDMMDPDAEPRAGKNRAASCA